MYWDRFLAPGVELGTVAHPSTNRARRRVTSLIEANALPLPHTYLDPIRLLVYDSSICEQCKRMSASIYRRSHNHTHSRKNVIVTDDSSQMHTVWRIFEPTNTTQWTEKKRTKMFLLYLPQNPVDSDKNLVFYHNRSGFVDCVSDNILVCFGIHRLE